MQPLKNQEAKAGIPTLWDASDKNISQNISLWR
jgi:hypothetical protein